MLVATPVPKGWLPKKTNKLYVEYKTFWEVEPYIEKYFVGKLVVIHKKEIIGFYDSFTDAYWGGLKAVGNEAMLIKEIKGV